jgi:hypothetical protein
MLLSVPAFLVIEMARGRRASSTPMVRASASSSLVITSGSRPEAASARRVAASTSWLLA